MPEEKKTSYGIDRLSQRLSIRPDSSNSSTTNKSFKKSKPTSRIELPWESDGKINSGKEKLQQHHQQQARKTYAQPLKRSNLPPELATPRQRMIRVAAIVCSVTAGVASVLMGKVGDEPGEIPHVYTPIRRWWRKKKATMFEDLQLSDEELSLRKDNDQIYNGDSSSSGNEYSNDSNTAGDGSSGSSSESDVCNVKVGLASLSNEADTVIRVDSSDDEGKRRNNTIFTR